MADNFIRVVNGETNLIGASKTSIMQWLAIDWNEVTILGFTFVRTGDLDGAENLVIELFDKSTPDNAFRTSFGIRARRVYAMVTDSQAYPQTLFVAGSEISTAETMSRSEEPIEYRDKEGVLNGGNVHMVVYNPSAKAQKYGYSMWYTRRAR